MAEAYDLEEKANQVRMQTLEMCTRAGSGHVVSSFSCTDILVALYYGGILRFDPANPKWDKRDRFYVSKGHGAMALYPILADLGFFAKDELSKFSQNDGILGAHPDNNIPGIEVVTGSLGHGLGLAIGMALCAKIDKKEYITIALLGDGECYEGSIWEGAMFAGHHQLNNLIGIIDRNGLSVTDFTEKSLRLNPLKDKWHSFGWDVVIIDGHSFREIFDSFKDFRLRKSNKPLMIIANTVKGKGVSFMENSPLWHNLVPTDEQTEMAMRELKEKRRSRYNDCVERCIFR
ncbi:transketolase [Patescibacteria group bacterium]|nr:transketolase [Patescibacteria group bacterium]MBU0846460.1 transketolase [Patescibacteria group bacterium]